VRGSPRVTSSLIKFPSRAGRKASPDVRIAVRTKQRYRVGISHRRHPSDGLSPLVARGGFYLFASL
jgi:hypothetical protein